MSTIIFWVSENQKIWSETPDHLLALLSTVLDTCVQMERKYTLYNLYKLVHLFNVLSSNWTGLHGIECMCLNEERLFYHTQCPHLDEHFSVVCIHAILMYAWQLVCRYAFK